MTDNVMRCAAVSALHIILPYPDAGQLAEVRAHSEYALDLADDLAGVVRSRMAFAAVELQRFLRRTLPEADIRITATSGEGFRIELLTEDPLATEDSYTIVPLDNGLRISGKGRAGVLYGCYELLRLQGWRWYAPGPPGEIAPASATTLVLPTKPLAGRPAMDLGRGFDFEYQSMESAELLLWMARNRLNLSGSRPATRALTVKLGMSAKAGGHIFEALLDPQRVMPSGSTLWEEHADWFGMPASGVRTIETAQRIQFCMSQPDLLAFLAEELLSYLLHEWHDADRIDVWGFDNWGDDCACACPGCRTMGNASDKTLHFISHLRAALQQARHAGRLNRDVRLVMCAYEGTATLQPPTRPIPANLLEAGDYVVFYPINRCYSHDFFDPACPINAVYADALAGWLRQSPRLPMMIGEYYNVSKFEDLPLLFTARIAHDLPAYHAHGVRGITYMHVPMVNWAMRTLTQALYAQLAWEPATDVEAFLTEYFAYWYGPHAEQMREVYQLIEQGWCDIASWRAWAPQSVLSQLQRWDGAKPQAPLQLDAHFQHAGQAIRQGRQALLFLRKADRLLQQLQQEEDMAIAGAPPVDPGAPAVNPIESRRQAMDLTYAMRLGEDRRLLRYGIDTLRAMVAAVAYHDALFREDTPAADRAWQALTAAAAALDSYYVPIGYEWPTPGLESKDALTRSQLREVIVRCRRQRMQ